MNGSRGREAQAGRNLIDGWILGRAAAQQNDAVSRMGILHPVPDLQLVNADGSADFDDFNAQGRRVAAVAIRGPHKPCLQTEIARRRCARKRPIRRHLQPRRTTHLRKGHRIAIGIDRMALERLPAVAVG